MFTMYGMISLHRLGQNSHQYVETQLLCYYIGGNVWLKILIIINVMRRNYSIAILVSMSREFGACIDNRVYVYCTTIDQEQYSSP